ncbi:hypothetical protein Golax_002707 [Gossypium laxum]|uniref:Uncharacterized protein n=1 Tax=Gossypium laxum TaxID=34288 RepID=A0A7J9AS30_9ROSI|nr:hypothetical protein [Gossypium laxum]
MKLFILNSKEQLIKSDNGFSNKFYKDHISNFILNFVIFIWI